MLKAFGDDPDPVALKIEVFSLGKHYGKHDDKDDMSIPLDLLEPVSERFSVELSQLVRTYTAGMMEGLKEKQTKD